MEYIYGFVRWGGLQAKSMTSQRAEPSKMAGMRYHGNVMTTTRWRLYVTMETLWQKQDGGYALLWYIVTAKVDWACYRCILHLQQYSHRLNFFLIFHVYRSADVLRRKVETDHRHWIRNRNMCCLQQRISWQHSLNAIFQHKAFIIHWSSDDSQLS